MDPLSISASVAGLITISTQILGIISDFKSKNNKELDSLAREINAVRGILCQIQQIVQFQSVKPNKNEEWLGTLNATLDNCGDVYLALQTDLRGLTSHSKLDSLKSKIKWTLKDKDIQDRLRKIESYKLSLELLLSVQTSTKTSNIEDILIQIQKKLSLKPAESPAVRTPLSWRRKLAGFEAGFALLQPNSNSSISSDVQRSGDYGQLDTDKSYIISGPRTAGWDKPGAYGITHDAGFHAPDINSPDITRICEIKIGSQKVSLLCNWQKQNMVVTFLQAHILFEGPSQGDVYFVQLQEPLEDEFLAPSGKSSLIFVRGVLKSSICFRDDLPEQNNPEDFQLAVGDFALKSVGERQHILVNFETARDREAFIMHFYAIRYLQRMAVAFCTPKHLYYHSRTNETRVQHVQVGYADGTEMSYIYPNIYVEHSLEDKCPRFTCGVKIRKGTVLFSEELSSLEFEVVGAETIVFTKQEGKTIRTISCTFGHICEVFKIYYRLKDIVREWEMLSKRRVDEYETRKEWKIEKLEFRESFCEPREPFHNVLVVLKSDRFYKRMKIEIFNEEATKTLASCYVVISSILYQKQHFQLKFPIFQASFWDLRDGHGETLDNFKTGQVRMYGANEMRVRVELEDLVEEWEEKTREMQKMFLADVTN